MFVKLRDALDELKCLIEKNKTVEYIYIDIEEGLKSEKRQLFYVMHRIILELDINFMPFFYAFKNRSGENEPENYKECLKLAFNRIRHEKLKRELEDFGFLIDITYQIFKRNAYDLCRTKEYLIRRCSEIRDKLSSPYNNKNKLDDADEDWLNETKSSLSLINLLFDIQQMS